MRHKLLMEMAYLKRTMAGVVKVDVSNTREMAAAEALVVEGRWTPSAHLYAGTRHEQWYFVEATR